MTTPTTPALVPVHDMSYEDFSWLVENGFDPFDTPAERERKAAVKLAQVSAALHNQAVGAHAEDLVDNHWLEAAISDAS